MPRVALLCHRRAFEQVWTPIRASNPAREFKGGLFASAGAIRDIKLGESEVRAFCLNLLIFRADSSIFIKVREPKVVTVWPQAWHAKLGSRT